MKAKIMELNAIIEIDEAGEYFAYCPDLNYAYTSGKTVDEALENLKDVICLQKSEIKKSDFKVNTPFIISRLQMAI